MEQVLEFLKGFNIQTIFSLGAIVWFFSRHVITEMKLIEAKLEERMTKQEARTDRLYEMFVDHRKEVDQKFYDLLLNRK